MKTFKYLIRKRALGDVLWLEPIVAALAKKNKKLIVHTCYNELFENYPFKNVLFKKKLSLLEKAFARFSHLIKTDILFINLNNAYEKNPNVHFLNAYQMDAKLPLTKEYPKLYLSEKEKTERIIEGKYVILHLESFSAKKFRQVYGVDWKEVIKYISSCGYKTVQIGTNSNPVPGAITIATTIRQLISLIYNSAYFIGLDSGPSHIAASLGIPSLVFFGAINPKLRHFPTLFRGILVKQPCEYDERSEKLSYEKLECTLADVHGRPACCIYTTDFVIAKIDELTKTNVAKTFK